MLRLLETRKKHLRHSRANGEECRRFGAAMVCSEEGRGHPELLSSCFGGTRGRELLLIVDSFLLLGVSGIATAKRAMISSGASRGSLHEGASLKVEGAHFAACKKGSGELQE